jgi:hypothetical protein
VGEVIEIEGGSHTDRIRSKISTCEAKELRKFATMDGTDVKQVLPSLPH